MSDPLLVSANHAPVGAASEYNRRQAQYEAAKGWIDRLFAATLLLVIAPILLLLALLLCLDSPGPALFVQERVGRHGRSFRLLKFRSMRTDSPNIPTAEMQKLGIITVTRFGRFLRRTSLDELPQLVNILRGEMSLVGPRPSLASQEQLNHLRSEAGVDVLIPGITGWAQINGRDDLTDEQKVAHDAYYLHHRSMKLDFNIIIRTILPVITGKGNQ